MEQICKRCGASFEFPIPKNFCPDDTCLVFEEPKTHTCLECAYTWKLRSEQANYCPKCKKPVDKLFIPEKKEDIATCNRCNYSWKKRKETVRLCPKCKNPNWNADWVELKIPISILPQVKALIGRIIGTETISEIVMDTTKEAATDGELEYEELSPEDAKKLFDTLL